MADVETESVIDSLREVYKAESKGESDTPETSPEPEPSEPELEAEAEDTEDEVSLGAESEEVEAATEEDEEGEEPDEVFQPPEHWSSDQKETFKSLPKEAQEVLIKRDAEFQKGYQERVQEVTNLKQAIEPYKQVIAQFGVSEADAVRTLFATYMQIAQRPVDGILALAQRFNALDQLKEQFAPDTDDDFADPEIKALRNQVKELNTQLGNFQNQTAQQQQETLLSQIDSFKNKTDDKGDLVHPYFDQVRTRMAPLVNEGKSLEDAYNEVVWTVPEFRDKHLKTVAAKKKAESDEEKARRVKKAKTAAKTNKTSGKSTVESKETLSVKQELEAAWNQ